MHLVSYLPLAFWHPLVLCLLEVVLVVVLLPFCLPVSYPQVVVQVEVLVVAHHPSFLPSSLQAWEVGPQQEEREEELELEALQQAQEVLLVMVHLEVQGLSKRHFPRHPTALRR